MHFPSSSSRINTIILLVIATAWLYTEVSEYKKREAFTYEIKEFMRSGDRFTQMDGMQMQEEIRELQATVSILLETEAVEHPELCEHSHD